MRGLTALAALAATLMSGSAMAADITLQLNWKAGGDHAPIYYALAQGWYQDAGVNLQVQQGNGSGASAQALVTGQADIAIIDTPTALQFLGEGAEMTGVFVAYNDNATGFYWKKDSGIEDIAGLAGHKIGAPATDAIRQFWPAIARAAGIEPDSVEWVNIQPTAKVAALQSGAIDATQHMYSVHFVYEDVFGEDLGYQLVRDTGLNPYGLTYWASNASIAEQPEALKATIGVTQKAFAFCLETPAPCAEALSSAVSMRLEDATRELEYASAVMPGAGNTLPIGAWDPARVEADYQMARESFGVGELDPATIVTNDFLDMSVHYPTN